ncbi:hypothetical protein XENTR_v10000359 [Xenopus tropicalis]|nr:hypothetical protein XENTR_v10000359 [Xenopus tropicalis]
MFSFVPRYLSPSFRVFSRHHKTRNSSFQSSRCRFSYNRLNSKVFYIVSFCIYFVYNSNFCLHKKAIFNNSSILFVSFKFCGFFLSSP